MAEEPYVVPIKQHRRPKGRGGLRIRDPSEDWFKDTHASSTHEEGEEKQEEEEDEGEGVPSPKRKRVASEDTKEEEEHPQARRKLHKA